MSSAPPIRITHDLRLMVASTIDGGAAPDHLRAVAGLIGAAGARADSCRYACASAEGAMDRARNALVGVFLASDASHLLLVDGAIGFEPDAVLDAIERMQADPAIAVLTAPCPTRHISWALIAAAERAGIAADQPAGLARLSGQFVIDLATPDGGIALDQPVELATAEAGLMVIRRDVIESLCESHPELRYASEPEDREAGAVGEWLHALFQSTVDPATGRMLSGTMLFSYRARSAGFRLWLAPWLQTTNTGAMRFVGSLAALAEFDPPRSD